MYAVVSYLVQIQLYVLLPVPDKYKAVFPAAGDDLAVSGHGDAQYMVPVPLAQSVSSSDHIQHAHLGVAGRRFKHPLEFNNALVV